MNKSYSKPSTTLQSMKLEGSFMNCSIRGDMEVMTQNYDVFSGFDTVSDPTSTHYGSTSSDWKIGFDE